MKKLLLAVLGLIVILVLGVVGYASTQPDAYHVERSVSLTASGADVFPYVNDYGKWATWNPFRHSDPNMKTETSENPVGVGAWTSWEGTAQVGSGKMTILESAPEGKVVHRIDFHVPMEDTGTATFSWVPTADGLTFTWAMDGQMNLFAKVFSLFSGMDAMLGPQFELGLGELKAAVEADAKARLEAEAAAAAAAAVVPVDPAAVVDPAVAPTP